MIGVDGGDNKGIAEGSAQCLVSTISFPPSIRVNKTSAWTVLEKLEKFLRIHSYRGNLSRHFDGDVFISWNSD